MGLRGLLLRIAAISAPFVAVFALVVVVDPYNYFGWSRAIPNEVKLKSLYHSGRTMAFSNMMWELLRFEKKPVEHVLLGDSRLTRFDLGHLKEVTGVGYANMGVPGGNYRTIADLFAFTDSIIPLKDVVVQVSFQGMNTGNDWDFYSEPRLLLDKPLLYLTNRRVLEATLLNVKGTLAPNSVEYDKLPQDHWRMVIDMQRNNAANFRLDTANFVRLQRIADQCRKAGARLVFLEYPTWPEVRTLYTEAGLDPLRKQYIARLSSIATTIDLDRPGAFPTERSDWRDPLHPTAEAQRKVIDRVWGPDGALATQAGGH